MRRYRRASEWAEIIEEYKSSGRSVKSFCVERGLCDASLYRRLRQGECLREFIELPAGVQSGSYEICVDGVTLKVSSSEAAVRIAELMRAVRC